MGVLGPCSPWAKVVDRRPATGDSDAQRSRTSPCARGSFLREHGELGSARLIFRVGGKGAQQHGSRLFVPPAGEEAGAKVGEDVDVVWLGYQRPFEGLGHFREAVGVAVAEGQQVAGEGEASGILLRKGNYPLRCLERICNFASLV